MAGLMGGKQLGITQYELSTANKETKREKILSEMEWVVPWHVRHRQTLNELLSTVFGKSPWDSTQG